MAKIRKIGYEIENLSFSAYDTIESFILNEILL